MQRTRWIIAALALVCTSAAPAFAAQSGVQWTPDSDRILVQKDVGAERWAITLNVSDFSATGNIFFTDDRDPGFIWCEKTGHSYDDSIGELDLEYRCFGADRGFGGFHSDDWTLISDGIVLPLSFFIPEAETCEHAAALNGPSANGAGSFWNCGGSEGGFEFQLFADGTGDNTATAPFVYDTINEACTVAELDDGTFLDVEYSPSRDHLTIYETNTDVTTLIVSECERVNF